MANNINISELRELLVKLQVVLEEQENKSDVGPGIPIEDKIEPQKPESISHEEVLLLANEKLSDWWDNTDLMIQLRMSISTIRRRCLDGTLKPFFIGRRRYYWKYDVLKLRHRFMK